MSLVGFRCPSSAPTAGECNTIEKCLNECSHQCASPALLASIYTIDTGNHHVGNYISASMLAGGGCPRQTVLERKYPFYEVPLRRFWSFRGTHAHSMVEVSSKMMEKFGWLTEMRMKASVEYPDLPQPLFDADGKFTGEFSSDTSLSIEIGGTCDSYNPLKRALWDMKSCADAKAEMMITGSKPGTFSPHLEDSWVKQLNIYRWLISKTPTSPALRKKLKIKSEFLPAPEFLGIQGISMMNIPRTGQPYSLNRRGRGVTSYPIDDVPVWPLEDTEKFIKDEAIKWYRWLVLGIVPEVVPSSKKWLCDSCAFNGERVPEGICFPTKERRDSSDETLTIED